MKIIESLNNKNYINGEWVSFASTLEVDNPSTGEIIGSICDLDKENILRAINSTADNFASWSGVDLDKRVQILRNWHQLIIKHAEDIANIIVLEQGKVITDARNEVIYGASFIEWFCNVVYTVTGSVLDDKGKNQKLITQYEPVGSVAAITPWNFPCAMITRKITPALICGCSVVLKPSEFTPFTALFLTKLLEEAGLPGGVLNVITGEADLIGKEVCNDFRIRKISFTGSTRVGKILYQNSANSLKRLSLELGGNAPFIIFADSDLEKAANDLIISKTRGNGQSCTSANRVFIEAAIYDKFTQLLSSKFSSIVIGDCFDKASQLGSLINNAGAQKIDGLIEDAKARGAKILCGGSAKKNLFSPTVIIDCSDEMELFQTEIFGPVAACYKFSTLEEVIKKANDTEYGLQAYVYSQDLAKAQEVASKLDFGMVSINNPLSSNAKAAFSGRKASGFGIEGALAGLFEYLNTKYINIPIK